VRARESGQHADFRMKFGRQTTLRDHAAVSGIGVHTGLPATLTILPAKADTGIVFVRCGANGEPDASDTLKSDAGSNFSSYKNPQMDQLLAQGLAEPNVDKRKPIYDQIQKIVSDDVPFIYMMYWNWFNHFSKRVQGLPKSALNGSQLYNKAYQWWFA